MPADVNQAKQLLFTSDYPNDKVVYLETGSTSFTASTSAQLTTIPHGLPFTPLVGGNWALTSDFSVQYEFATYIGGNVTIYDYAVNVYADADNVYIYGDNITGTTKTLYYRIYGFQPPADTSEVTSLNDTGDNFILNTDYNYMKLYLSDTETLPSTQGTGVETTVSIPHGLGYVPQAVGWITYTTNFVPAVHPFGTTHPVQRNIAMYVDSTNVSFYVPAYVDSAEVYYRIYLDESA